MNWLQGPVQINQESSMTIQKFIWNLFGALLGIVAGSLFILTVICVLPGGLLSG